MDFLSILENLLEGGLLFLLLWLLARKIVDVIEVIAMSMIAKTIAKSGYDVTIGRKGVSLSKRKSGSSPRK